MGKRIRDFGLVATLGVTAFTLSSCTTIATEMTAHPPGVNRYSFRDCLIDNGFFTPAPLSGMAETGYETRRTFDHKAPPSPAVIEAMADPLFVVETGSILRESFFPHLEYGDAVALAEPGFGGEIGEEVANKPYFIVPAGGGVEGLAQSSHSPRPGFEPPRFCRRLWVVSHAAISMLSAAA